MIKRHNGFTRLCQKAPPFMAGMNGRTSLAGVLQSRTKAGLSGFGEVSPSHRKPRDLSRGGFTLVELLVAMVMFVLVIVAATNIFTSMFTQFKQQSKIAETNIEGIIGLDILRLDIEHAGYGLPWNVTNVTGATTNWADLTGYFEALSVGVLPDPANFNDGTPGGTGGSAPRAILSDDDADFNGGSNIFDGSDYLVIKSSNVAISAAAQKWTHQRTDDTGSEFKRSGLSGLNEVFVPGDRVVVIFTGSTGSDSRSLVVSGGPGSWYTNYNLTSGFAPGNINDTNLIYGIDPDTSPLRMPFNRADYYIWRGGATPNTDGVPDRCAFNTGVLRKAVISQDDGIRQNPLPLIDCVADFQVVYRLDINNDGTITLTNDISFLTAMQIRGQVKGVEIYILAHEGQRDPNFTYATNPVTVGPPTGEGRPFDLTAITDWQDYRWKVYTLVVKTEELG